MGGTIGWRLPRPFQHLGLQLRGEFLWWLTGMDRRQAQNAFLFIALLPSRDGRWRSPELFLNISIADTLIEQKNDPHALRYTCRQIPAAQAGVQFAALGRSQVQDFHLRHKLKDEDTRYLLLKDSPLVLLVRCSLQ